jgi:D-glycero-alpha-D-manno-heptose-7-phosphate kinase
LGAGGGGFMVFYVPKPKQNKIFKTLKNNLFIPFNFDYKGSEIVVYKETEEQING